MSRRVSHLRAPGPPLGEDAGLQAAALAQLRAMAGALSEPALRELTATLSAWLHRELSKRELRVQRLGPLAALLAPLPVPPGQDAPTADQALYDATRPEHAPASRALVEIFGSWRETCRAAYGLRPDGRYAGISTPWERFHSAGLIRKPYSDEEIFAALNRCRRALGHDPSPAEYQRWRDRERDKQKRVSRQNRPDAPAPDPRQRIPSLQVILSRWTWPTALSIAGGRKRP